MNQIKKIGLFLTILMIKQIGLAREPRIDNPYQPTSQADDYAGYNQEIMQVSNNAQKMFEQSAQQSPADKFIEQSYVFPSQQVAICTLFGKPFASNTVTGQPVLLGDDNQLRNWPTVEEILDQAQGSARDAVFAAKQAIEIAIENARLTFALQADESSMNQIANSEAAIMQDLAAKKQAVEQAFSKQRGNVESLDFDHDAIFSMQEKLNNADVTIYTMQDIENKIMTSGNDFKFLVNNGKATHAADLLLRQCYIAQQGKNIAEHEKLSSLLSNAKNQHGHNPAKIHQNLTAVARAIKTALYIAQNEYGRSWYNPTAYIPVYASYTTHPLISKLQDMDEIVRKDLINPKYGATQADINRQYYLDLATSIAKGIVITGVVVGTLAAGAYAVNNKDVIQAKVSDAYKSGKETVFNLPTAVKNKTVEVGQIIYDSTVKPFVGEGKSKEQFFGPRAQAAHNELKKAELATEIAKAKIESAKKLGANKATLDQLQKNFETAQIAKKDSETTYLQESKAFLRAQIESSQEKQNELLTKSIETEALRAQQAQKQSGWFNSSVAQKTPKTPEQIALEEEIKRFNNLTKQQTELDTLVPVASQGAASAITPANSKPLAASSSNKQPEVTQYSQDFLSKLTQSNTQSQDSAPATTPAHNETSNKSLSWREKAFSGNLF